LGGHTGRCGDSEKPSQTGGERFNKTGPMRALNAADPKGCWVNQGIHGQKT
jgi:hypothetical protein